MLTSKELLESGLLELYVSGKTSEAESREVELLAAVHPEIKNELAAIEAAIKSYALAAAETPNPVIKPFLLATIDYIERLKAGEPAADPPELNEHSLVTDYEEWLSREDLVAPQADEVFAKIIGYTPKAITAIVWLTDYAPHEVHDDEFERFLIVEGTCEIIVEEEINQLGPGDYFAIPLHKNHMIKVTSSVRCKVILQRIAA